MQRGHIATPRIPWINKVRVCDVPSVMCLTGVPSCVARCACDNLTDGH